MDFDDGLYVTENPHVRDGLTWEGIKWALSADLISDSPSADFWIPLTFISHMVAVEIFGLDPSGHHLINVLLHGLNSVLVFLIFRRMTGALWPSALVAALFALHPLHVESVAWVTERKDVLSTFFLLLTLWAYFNYVRHPGFVRYILVMVTFVMGLMAKPVIVTLPFVLLLLDYWPLNRFSSPEEPDRITRDRAWRLVREKIPLFMPALASGVITLLAVHRIGATAPLELFSFATRLGNAVVAYAAYMVKMFWPSGLAVYYPHPGDALSAWRIAGSALVLIVVSVLVIRQMGKKPYLAVGWFFFLGTLFPVIGILQAGSQAMADRYTYVPLTGLFIMAAWGLPELFSIGRSRKVILSSAAALLIAALMSANFLQVRHWRDSIALFGHAVQATENNPLAHNNLAWALVDQSRIEEAVPHLKQVVRIRSDYSRARMEFDNLNLSQEQLNRAIEGLEEMSRLGPGSPEGRNRLGLLYFEILGHPDEAMREFQAALTLNPASVEARNNLGLVYKSQNKLDDAVREFRAALAVRPDLALIHFNLGNTYRQKGMLPEARRSYERAAEIQPDYSEALEALAALLPLD